MEKVVFWGATGQAKVLYECLSRDAFQLVSLFDNNATVSSPIADVPLYYGKEEFEKWLSMQEKKKMYFLVAIGGDKGEARISVQYYLESKGLIPLTAIHPTAFVASNAELGRGTQVLANASVCVEARLGEGCIVNTNAVVDHECQLGKGVHICPGATLAGCVTVEDFVMIGTGATILPRLTIGKGSIVGAGAVVIKSVPSNSIVVGNPAIPLKQKKQLCIL